jgi:formylmethanofuran dehydrogenase subunit E
MWKRYKEGDRAPEVLKVVHARKARKMQMILNAPADDLFEIKHLTADLPETARIYPSLICDNCGEKVMEPRTRKVGEQTLCIPCAEK